MVKDLQAADLPFIFEGGGGTLLYPLGNLYKPNASTRVIMQRRILNTHREARTVGPLGIAPTTIPNTPIAGTVSVFYTNEDGARAVTTSFTVSGAVVTITNLPPDSSLNLSVRYRYLGANNIIVVKSGENASIANDIPLPPNSQITSLNTGSTGTFTGYVVEQL